MLRLRRFLCDEDGPTAVEYAVMLAMILGVLIVSITAVGGQNGGMWANIRTSLNNVNFGS